MDLLNEKILQEYDEQKNNFEQLRVIVCRLINDRLREKSQRVMQVDSRVKARDSLEGKLIRKPEKYRKLSDITDILGVRVICYFTDQAQECAGIIEQMFEVDYSNSVDKRKIMAPDAFGYLSTHFICTLRSDGGWPEELVDLPFEIQLRSVLQHTWAEIEHDLGYKSEFGIPREMRREFSRVAAMLEVADNIFLNLKRRIALYQEEVLENIDTEQAAELPLDQVTLSAFLARSRSMRELLTQMTEKSGARLREVPSEGYLPQLRFLGVHTIGDLLELLSLEWEHALQLSRHVLSDPEIEEAVNTIGLYYLCRARLIYGTYDEAAITDFFRLNDEDEATAARHARQLLRRRAELPDAR